LRARFGATTTGTCAATAAATTTATACGATAASGGISVGGHGEAGQKERSH
jgi:hypothetical protein